MCISVVKKVVLFAFGFDTESSYLTIIYKSHLTLPKFQIKRVNSVKIHGVTLSDELSVEDHVHAVISSAAQTLHALRVLRSHGMDDAALQMVYRVVIVSKLQYASCAFWGFSTAADWQRINAFLQRSASCGFVPVEEICQKADATLFRSIINNHNHVLFHLLPPQSTASQNYNLCKYRRELTI